MSNSTVDNEDTESWNIDCSDEELSDTRGIWEPAPEVIDRLFVQLERGDIPKLHWKCPGYRSPSPEIKEIKPRGMETETKHEEDKSDFDFMDETTASPRLKIRHKGKGEEGAALKGSAKKKTTSLDGVINNMRRHNMLPRQPQSNNH